MRFQLYSVAVLAVTSLAVAAPLFPRDDDIIQGSYIVVVKNNSAEARTAHTTWVKGVLAASTDSGAMGDWVHFPTWSMYPLAASEDVVSTIQDNDNVEEVEPARTYKISASRDIENNEVTIQGSTRQAGLSGLQRISSATGRLSAADLASKTYDFVDAAGAGVDVYVVDTGIRSNHPQFGNRVDTAAGFSQVFGTSEDDNGHGTHCAGTVAGNDVGVANKATLIPVKVLGADGSGSNQGILAGLAFIARQVQARGNPAVVSMSLGGSRSNAVNRAIRSVVTAGASAVVAAGNEAQDACNVSPASEPQAITVAAIDARSDLVPNFSNFGRCVDISAPGFNVLSTWIGNGRAVGNNGQFNQISGTSMSTPHVSGAVALMLSQNPNLTPAQVTQVLAGNAQTGIRNLRANTVDAILFQGGEAGFDLTRTDAASATNPQTGAGTPTDEVADEPSPTPAQRRATLREILERLFGGN